jgi:chromate transporter
VPFPVIVLVAAAIGALGGRFLPGAFATKSAHAAEAAAHAPALIDDDTPTPVHARFRWSRLAMVVGIAIALWLAAFVIVVALDSTSTLATMAWFFTKAALLTFGGAYAVLPYVYQGAVETYGWLTPPQMIDGLALGETTPGPLIMVVAFVGFVGGWTKAVFGTHLIAGIAGASVATFFTFLPSFVFIFAGGPLVESTHGRLAFTAPLTGITAAVVGVIASLAAFFAYHVLWPHGIGGSFDFVSAVIAIAAAAALFRFNVGVIPVIGACGLVGLTVTLSRALA